MPEHFPVQNHYDKVAVCFDFDGHLAPEGTEGPPDPELYELTKTLAYRWGWLVIVSSARPAAHHPQVEAWLDEHEVPYAQLALGVKPAADVFLDDRSPRLHGPALVEWVQRQGERRLGMDPLARVAAGRGQGQYRIDMLPAQQLPFQGQGELTDPAFRVVVPFSGGLDSATAWLLAARSGLPYQLVYVDTGVAYTEAEVAAARRLLAILGDPWNHGWRPELQVIEHPTLYLGGTDFIDLGRNTIIVQLLAEHLTASGGWGEIWMGAIDQPGEMPVVGGDKSHRWYLTTQQVLSAEGHQVRLCQPLGGWTKTMAIRWWQQVLTDGAQLAADLTRSCYAPTPGHCGRCRACLRRWLAFHAAAPLVRMEWPQGHDLGDEVDRMRAEQAAAASPSVAFAPGRTEQEWAALDDYQPQEA